MTACWLCPNCAAAIRKRRWRIASTRRVSRLVSGEGGLLPATGCGSRDGDGGASGSSQSEMKLGPAVPLATRRPPVRLATLRRLMNVLCLALRAPRRGQAWRGGEQFSRKQRAEIAAEAAIHIIPELGD